MSTVAAPTTDHVSERITELLALFKLPTAAREMTPRLQSAGHGELLPSLLEVLELEAGDRRAFPTDSIGRIPEDHSASRTVSS